LIPISIIVLQQNIIIVQIDNKVKMEDKPNKKQKNEDNVEITYEDHLQNNVEDNNDDNDGPTMKNDSTIKATGITISPTTVQQQSDNAEEKTPQLRSVITAVIESFKYLYSLALLLFCITVVMGALFTKQTTSTSQGFSTVGAFFIFWILILWLAMMEGGQGALVGLQPIDPQIYEETHPKSYKNTTIVHHNNNMERFIVGRQFLVVLVVFVSQFMSSAIPEIQLWGLSRLVTEIFLNSGVALMVVTIVCGQLTAQLNAANCMLDFINNYFMLYFVTYLSLIIEYSGLLHCAYLVQIVFSKLTAKTKTATTNTMDEEDDEEQTRNRRDDPKDGNSPNIPVSGDTKDNNKPPEQNLIQIIFFWLRVTYSLAILGFAFAVTLSALLQGKTTMWVGVPDSVSVVLFFVLMCVVGMMEGMQIALFAVVNIPSEQLERQSTGAYNHCRLAFREKNLQAFLIGRQICVTICTFVIARITTLSVEVGAGENIFNVSDGMQSFFNTGLLGAIITTIVSSLAWRIVASSFPVAFLSNPLIGLILRLCLLLEASGICSSAWVLARYHKPLVNYQTDEIYYGRTTHCRAGHDTP
jgi:hypothetical protein